MKTLRIKLLGLLFVTMCLSIAFFAGAANVQAQTTQTAVFEMVEGASVRTETPSGIRFVTKVNQAYKDTLSSDLSYVWGTKLTFTEVGGKSYAIDVDTQVWTDETQTEWNTVLLDIPKTDYLTEITAESYVKGYAKDDLEIASVVFYDTVENAQIRSLAQTAALALNKGFTNDVLYDYVSVIQTEVELGTTSLELTVGDETILSATNTGNYAMVYSSSNSEVVTVDNSGNVVAVGAGDAEITVQVGNNKATCAVTVSEKVKTTNEVLIDSAVQSYRDSENSYNYFYTNVNASEDSSEKYNEQNSIRYTVSDDGRSTTAGRRWFVPMEFDTENPFVDLLATMDMSVEDITAKTRVRFYVKNASTSYELAFVLMDTSKKWFGLGDISSLAGSSFNAGVTHVNIPANSGWTKVDFSLSDVYESLINGTGRISLCAGYINTGNPFVDQTYYMGGFEIYRLTKEDIVANYSTYLATSYEAGIANAQKSIYDSETVIKYDVIVGERIANVTGSSRNVFANMFVGKQGIPTDVLSAYGITSTTWASGIRVSFDVYSDKAIEFKTQYTTTSSTPEMGSSVGTGIKTITANTWNTITIDFTSITSATFAGWVRIFTRLSCTSYDLGSTAYTYYVKNFNIEEITVEGLLPNYATYFAGWLEAGKTTAQTTILNGEKVVKYDVAISEKIANQGSANIHASMFALKTQIPQELLNVLGIDTTTGWTNTKITFKIYCEDTITIKKNYGTGIDATGTEVQTAVAGQWTTITVDFADLTSATFDSNYKLQIITRVTLSKTNAELKAMVGEHAYTYYVKDFNITVA